MKISASNIGWKKEFDIEMYSWMSEQGIEGLEIAPTRIFEEAPYEHISEAEVWAKEIMDSYGLTVSSMQSIWYGRTENIFASKEQRETLIQYTKSAIEFAQAIGCKNLVFGCPRNRSYEEGTDISVADEFFGILGDYAYGHGTVLAMEANPPIYNTNFCNTTDAAFELVKRVGSRGFKINLDLGTMLENSEYADFIEGKTKLINHVHVSEPGLAVVWNRDIHKDIADILIEEKYDRFVSMEIKTQDNIDIVKNTLKYIKSVFE